MVDDDGLADFCAAEWPRLVGTLSLYLGRRDQAEDLAQEALVRVCTHWTEVRGASSPSAWAHRVAFNLAKSSFRRGATWRRIRHDAGRQLRPAERDETSAIAVRDALQRLPAPQREALVLRYFADLSVREVARLMSCPENTVKTHTRRALDALRTKGLLDDEVPEPLSEEAR